MGNLSPIETVQAEVLSPDDLLVKVRAGLEAVTDAGALQAAPEATRWSERTSCRPGQ
ncbi:hypothetical protein [Actinacidiphila oryziradicis]|uniref:hypothetical protein n=1 Tax=Actinacidiphila oryziradicis TaxID=2571141 RepID=UPI00145C976F|nr:hypothetical protein [Actinacidiphila oryziradicis]